MGLEVHTGAPTEHGDGKKSECREEKEQESMAVGEGGQQEEW